MKISHLVVILCLSFSVQSSGAKGGKGGGGTGGGGGSTCKGKKCEPAPDPTPTPEIGTGCSSELPIMISFSNPSEIKSCWTFIDSDGDGLNFDILNISESNQLVSYSHINGVWPFTPDNWAITQAIDLTSVALGKSINLSWKVKVTHWDADNESYTVYVANDKQISQLASSNISFSEILDGSYAIVQNRSLDLSGFAGQVVYIGFRHHQAFDQSAVVFDDISVTAEN